MKSILVFTLSFSCLLLSCRSNPRPAPKFPPELRGYEGFLGVEVKQLEANLDESKLIVTYPFDGEAGEKTKFAILIARKDINTSTVSFFRFTNLSWEKVNTYTTPTGMPANCKYRLEYLGRHNCFVLSPFQGDGYDELYVFGRDKKSVNKIDAELYNIRPEQNGFVSSRDTIPYNRNNLPFRYTLFHEYYRLDSLNIKIESGDYRFISDSLFLTKHIVYKTGFTKWDTLSVNVIKAAHQANWAIR